MTRVFEEIHRHCQRLFGVATVRARMASRKYDDLNREELTAQLQARDRRDATRFGLVWEADEIERDNALNSDFVALDLVPELSCPGGAEAWRNLIIEGDNFDALRHLKMCFAGQVKCIYIDPPYNTGNRDFVYNDRFVDKEDSWRHSKWCEFMFQRLMLARDLLALDGAMFVSIDDNEVFALGMLMNRVFGEGNFVGSCIWQKKYAAANDHKTIAPVHDYILVYRASPEWQRRLLVRGAEKDRQYRHEDANGVFRCSDYTCNKSAKERPNLFYPLTQPNTGEEIWPKESAAWRYSRERHAENVQKNLVYWGKDGFGKIPSFKRYKHSLKNAGGVVPTTWWPFTECGHNDEAKKELLAILPELNRAFSTPKPVRLIERILQIACGPNDLVLDFFAGSGTTAHAVHKLNAEDGGKRRVILVSSTEATADEPEKNLCRDVCATRVWRVIEGYTPAAGEAVPGLGGDFAYLRTRRIAPGRLLEIEHAQVWTALQLIHRATLAPFADTALQWAGDAEEAVGYVPRFRREDAPALRKAVRASGTVTLYSWQPQTVAQHVRAGHVTHLPIPESLARRFGLRS